MRKAATELEPPRRERSRRGEGERLRAEILEATQQLLAATGNEDAVSIRAVAKAVGVSSPAIYLHFPDKEALLDAVCRSLFARLDEVLEAAVAQAGDPADAIRRVGSAYVHYGLKNPEAYRILFMRRFDESTPHWDGRDFSMMPGASAFQRVVEVITSAIDSGVIVPDDPFVTAVGCWLSMHGLTSALIAMPDFPWPPLDTLLERMSERCVTLTEAPKRKRGRN